MLIYHYGNASRMAGLYIAAADFLAAAGVLLLAAAIFVRFERQSAMRGVLLLLCAAAVVRVLHSGSELLGLGEDVYALSALTFPVLLGSSLVLMRIAVRSSVMR